VDLLVQYSDSGRVFLIDESGVTLRYDELVEISGGIADYINDEFDVGHGDPVALVMSNRLEFIEYLFALWSIGAKVVVIDPLTASEDLQYQLEDSSPRLVITERAVMDREYNVISKHAALIVEDHKISKRGRLRGDQLRPKEDVAIIMYYAGIAGRTMQVMHTHFNLYSCSLANSEMGRITEKDTSLLVAPLSHVLGLLQLLSTMAKGGRVVIVRGFEPLKVARLVREYGVTLFSGVPLMFEALLRNPQVDQASLSTLRLCTSGAAPLSPEVQLGFQERFGIPLVQGYGLTEALAVSAQPVELSRVTGTVGIPIIDVDVKIVDPRDPDRELGIGEVGELLVKSPWIMKGYSDPEETKNAIHRGWLRTGDLMIMDENGLLYFRGVRKRMIKYKAYPIFPRDLEEILKKHPAVKEALVVGESDPSLGELPVAYVTIREGFRVSEEELLNFVNSRVAFYKKIRRLTIVDKLPTP